MSIAKKLLDQHKTRIKFEYEGLLPPWAVTMIKEELKQEQVKKLNIDDVSVSFNDSERDEFIETTIFLNSQNLSGRETEDELYKQGITDCFDDLIEKINER